MLTNTIKEFIESREESTRTFSVNAGFSHVAMYRYVKDENLIPGNKTLKQLCEHFNEPPSTFLHFNPSK